MPTDHDQHDERVASLHAGSTRELNFGIITFVTILFVLLLVITIAGGTGWFRWEYNRAAARKADEAGLNPDLVRMWDDQRSHLDRNLDPAIVDVAERF